MNIKVDLKNFFEAVEQHKRLSVKENDVLAIKYEAEDIYFKSITSNIV